MELYFTYQGMYICGAYKGRRPDSELDYNLPFCRGIQLQLYSWIRLL
jgi:hypothetical protein